MNADQKKWTEISNAYETEPDERTRWQQILTVFGLCYAAKMAGIWAKHKRIKCSHAAYTYVSAIIGREAGFYETQHTENAPTYQYTRQHDLYRATFAAFMAALSPKDIKEMLDNETKESK